MTQQHLSLEHLDFSRCRILVVGDVMIDQYLYGATQRVSPEAPIPVVKVDELEQRPGGAGNVALNLVAMGAQVKLLGFRGDDDNGLDLQKQLEAQGVDCYFQTVNNQPTTTKLRVLSRHQQLIRLDFEEPVKHLDTTTFQAQFAELLDQADAVIFSDYRKGTLVNVDQLIELANRYQVPTFVDPKSDDFSCYQGATVITPNKSEFEDVVGKCENYEQLHQKAEQLLQDCQLSALLVTQGEDGMSLIRLGQPVMHQASLAQEVFDVTGAGDTVVASLALAYAAQCSWEQAINVANLAAGIVVGKLGAGVVTLPELSRAMAKDLNLPRGIIGQEQILPLVKQLKSSGKKLVMTNGCFDLLHPGHVHYLEQAKQLGDYLIVAVNSDASVASIKGEHRPINDVDTRMKMLTALDVVDWVVPFGELTPQNLIEQILPDVLVKGGDYEVSEVAGSSAVIAHGGQVEILDFVDGYSTSHLIEQINKQQQEESL